MTLQNTSLAEYISGKLRVNITDPNTSNRTAQFGNWIYADRPRIAQLLKNKNNWPRISVTPMADNTVDDMGMACEEQVERQRLNIDVWTVEDLICTVKKTDGEIHVYDDTVTIYTLSNTPTSLITLVTSGGNTYVKDVDYALIDYDSDSFYDAIQWIGVDRPSDGANFEVSYQRVASGNELCRFIVREIGQYMKTWRDWPEKAIWNYQKTAANPVVTDRESGVYRYTMTVTLDGIDIEESI